MKTIGKIKLVSAFLDSLHFVLFVKDNYLLNYHNEILLLQIPVGVVVKMYFFLKRNTNTKIYLVIDNLIVIFSCIANGFVTAAHKSQFDGLVFVR